MSLIGTAIGALVALIPARPPPEDDKTRDLALKVADLSEKFAALSRTRRELVNHIDLLARQLDAQRALANHWRGEAQRLAARCRVDRDMYEELLQRRDNQTQALPPSWRPVLAEQLQQHQQNALGQQLAAQQFDWQGLCNCVPSRAQVWGAHGSLVQQLNDRSE